MSSNSQPPPRGPTPAFNREYSGDFNTEGGPSYIGDGQNAGRDIINIFAEVVYYSRKRKESTTPEQESEKLAWRDFKQSLRSLGVNPIALTEHQVDMLLKAIAQITGVQDNQQRTANRTPKSPTSDTSSSKNDKTVTPVQDLQVFQEFHSSRSGFDDLAESTGVSDSSEDSEAVVEEFDKVAIHRDRFDGASTSLNRYRLGDSDSKATWFTKSQVSTLRSSLEGIRHHYSGTKSPWSTGHIESDFPSHNLFDTRASIPSATSLSYGEHPHELSFLEYPQNVLALSTSSSQIATSFTKAEWTRLRKELKQIGVHLIIASGGNRGPQRSFSYQKVQNFRQWCQAATSSSEELDHWCTPHAKPFIRAARDSDEIELRILLFRGTNVNTLMNNGMSALNIAVEKQAVPIIKLLMEHGASIEVGGDLQVTPLHQAAAGKDHFEIVEALLSQGGSIHIRGSQGWQAIHVAASWGHTSILQVLLAKGANIEAKNDFGATPLLIAASGQQTACVQFLLDQGAEVDATDLQGITALFHATFRRSLGTIVTLLEHGALIYHQDRTQATVLHHAMQHSFEQVVELLLSKGAPVEARDYLRHTPLHIAASRGLTNIVGCLLRHGSEVNSRTFHGETPLHIAASRGHYGVVELLLQNGASTSSISAAQMNPLSLAISGRHTPVYLLLLGHGALLNDDRCPPPLWLAVRGSNNDPFTWLRGKDTTIEHLVTRGVIDRREKITNTNALCLAVQMNSISIVNQLLASGLCNLQAQCGLFGGSALHFARSASMVELLIQHGADINATNYQGSNALHIAVIQNNVELAKLLLVYNIQSELKDHTGASPMILAIVRGCYDVVKLLIESGDAWENEDIEYALHNSQRNPHIPFGVKRSIAQALRSKIPSLELPIELSENLPRPCSVSSTYSDWSSSTEGFSNTEPMPAAHESLDSRLDPEITSIPKSDLSNELLPKFAATREESIEPRRAGTRDCQSSNLGSDSGPLQNHDSPEESTKCALFPPFDMYDTVHTFLQELLQDGCVPEPSAKDNSNSNQEKLESGIISPEHQSSSNGPEIALGTYKYPTVVDESSNPDESLAVSSTMSQSEQPLSEVHESRGGNSSNNPDAVHSGSPKTHQIEQTPTSSNSISPLNLSSSSSHSPKEPHAVDIILYASHEPEQTSSMEHIISEGNEEEETSEINRENNSLSLQTPSRRRRHKHRRRPSKERRLRRTGSSSFWRWISR